MCELSYSINLRTDYVRGEKIIASATSHQTLQHIQVSRSRSCVCVCVCVRACVRACVRVYGQWTICEVILILHISTSPVVVGDCQPPASFSYCSGPHFDIIPVIHYTLFGIILTSLGPG